ncbi:hypothetical protein, conserved [Trypanosoma brucei brucei TREU927]|uniref:ZIP Zinc transporter n=1 Tax=Trypanosoma brucei brucei (strain 927/4 GUTat10.1) TaxID=185431 RepID=Q57Z35_TRYB2|nr:hypothetical protein, conserved [Trypanosoma brucei brucei TREU927]AAX80615.1 hypothetical protein, conserved [Trypanosoma brucei]AAZ11525.1 hypothetical protein, conserved [Trypanosoma brucei brucei TREU927]
MLPFVALRVVAALVVTLFGVSGVVSPLLCLSNKCTTLFGGGTHTTFPHTLSLANCFAAGMLITIAVSHFFLHALEDAAARNADPSLVSLIMLSGILLPTVLDRIVDKKDGEESERNRSNGCCHGHGALLAQDDIHQGGRCGVPLVLLLMFFHAAMEGAVLGLEPDDPSLLTIVVPLCVHRLLDGVAIGVAISKKLFLATSCSSEELLLLHADGIGECTHNAGRLHGGVASTEMCLVRKFDRKLRDELWRWPVLLWLAITPAVALISAVLCSSSSDAAGGHCVGKHRDRYCKGHRPIPHNDTRELFKSEHIRGIGSLNSLVGAAGGGLFLFAGLMTILREEVHGLAACVSLLLGVLVTLLLGRIEI